MPAPYDSYAALKSPMADVAARLGATADCRLYPLVLMSDPVRTPDIVALAAKMPARSAIIYRHFGAEDRQAVAQALRVLSRDRGIQLLMGADADLAMRVGADGVHLPRSASSATSLKFQNPDWIITQAGQKRNWESQDVSSLDALFVSAIFPSDSPSAGTPIGVAALKERTRMLSCPVFALGGVTNMTAPKLIGSGAAGLASIAGLAQTLRTRPMNKQTVTISKDEGGELITFTATVEGESATGELTLRRVADGVWNANHTGVPKAIGGRGVGKALVEAMSEDARMQGYRVVPGCPFVAKLFERKPELAEGIT